MAILDFRFEEDEDDLSDDDGRHRRRGKSKLLKTIRRRISVVKRHEDDEEDYSSDEDENFGFNKVKRRLQKKKSEQGEKKRSSPKGLRMSRSKDANDDEEGDVAMPLPGQTADAVSVAHSRSSRGSSSSKKRGFRRIKNALVKSNSDNHSSVGSKSLQHNNNSKGKGSSVATGSNRSSSGKKRRQRKSTGSEGSNDSPPSVASTEISVDLASRAGASATGGSGLHQHAELRQMQQRQARKNAKQNNKNALNNIFGKREMDEMTGAAMEAMSMDYYYQSIPWIIKTWIYFLTVVVPFTLLYYCFVGIFHSASLNQNPFLQHVAISNLMFCGAGCTFRSEFFAKQALDSKGQFSKGVVPLAPLERKFTNGGTPIKRIPRNKRGVGFKEHSHNGLNRVLTAIPLPRVDTIKGAFRPKQKKNNGNPNGGGGIKNVAGQLSSRLLSQMSNGSERARDISSRLLDHSSKPASSRNLEPPSTPTRDTTTSPPKPNSGRHSRGARIGAKSTNTNNNNNNNHSTPPKTTATTAPPSPSNSPLNNSGGSSAPMSPRNSGSNSSSIWDVEHMIPQRSKKSGKPDRRSLDKHTSILEIYEFHAKDEKVKLLQ